MSADIINLSDYRTAQVAEDDIDLVTAVDVAVRDLRQILLHWPSEEAREQLQQCEAMLTRSYSAIDVDMHPTQA